MTKYAGLTDHPRRCRQEYGNPEEWIGTKIQSRIWEQKMHNTGYEGGKGDPGWGFGFTYTITKSAK